MFKTIREALEFYKGEVRRHIRNNLVRVAFKHKRVLYRKRLDEMARVLGLTVSEKKIIEFEIREEFENSPEFRELVKEAHLTQGITRKEMLDHWSNSANV